MPRRKNLTPRVTIREKDGQTYLRYRDPFTGREELRLVKGKYPSEWEREAGAWERELLDVDARRKAAKAQAAAAVANLTWAEFRKRFNDEHLMSLAVSTDLRFQTVFNTIEDFEKPRLLSEIDASYLSRLQAHLRASGRAEDTIASHLNHFKVALNWAKGVDLLFDVPKFPVVKRARRGQRRKPMKGRPPTPAEFEAMLAKAPDAVPTEMVPNWQRFMKALWWGGLRLEEALELYWDRTDKMRVDLDSQQFPVLRILRSTEKGKKDRIYPIAPEFAELLRATPEAQRKGLVFPLQTRKRKSVEAGRSVGQIGVIYASQRITEMGRLAGVVTRVDPRTGQQHFAGAHDFRRAFGTRWARIVKPLILKEMMRHESLETTMDYYVELDAEETAADIWKSWNIANEEKTTPQTRKTPARKKKRKENESGE